MNENIDKALEIMKNRGYDYYFDDSTIAVGALPGGGKSQLYGRRGNCSDEIVKGSHERTQKIRNLLQKKVEINEDWSKEWGKLLHDFITLNVEEHMALTGCSETQARLWVEKYINYHHVKQVEKDGKKYLLLDPKIGPKYKSD